MPAKRGRQFAVCAAYKYLFGPVPSRRFGRSLGVDLTPFKTCSLDCLFCQLGHHPPTSIERREYVPTRDVLNELADWHNGPRKADVVTLSGSGEPTLHTGFGEILRFVRASAGLPAVLLSNGTLMHLPEVRLGAQAASIVKVSLSAWDQASFERVNRPHPSLKFAALLEGYRALRRERAEPLWLEVFLMAGVNADPEQVRRIAELAQGLRPDRIQLNTTVRPAADPAACAVSQPALYALARLFSPAAEVVEHRALSADGTGQADQSAVLRLIERRPCTARQIADALNLHPNAVSKLLGLLAAAGRASPTRRAGEDYWKSNR